MVGIVACGWSRYHDSLVIHWLHFSVWAFDSDVLVVYDWFLIGGLLGVVCIFLALQIMVTLDVIDFSHVCVDFNDLHLGDGCHDAMCDSISQFIGIC